MNREKLMKMADAVRTGGKGSLRRKKKVVHKTTAIGADDKILQRALQSRGAEVIPAIQEVNIFKDDTVIQFINPKVQVFPGDANTWVVSGSPQTKKLQHISSSRSWAQVDEDDDEVPELVAGETFEAAAEEVAAT